MPDPITLLALGSTLAGGLGSIFGSGSKTEIPPELREIYNMLTQRAQEGLSDKTIDAILQRAKTNLGQEAGALGALTESRLTRAGAGTGVKQAALNRINKQRLLGIGEAATSAELADEQAKQQALNQLAQLAPLFGDPNFVSEYGQGFGELFGSGLNFLLNRPQGIQQLTQNPIQQGVNEFAHPQTPARKPQVGNNPYQLQFGGY